MHFFLKNPGVRDANAHLETRARCPPDVLPPPSPSLLGAVVDASTSVGPPSWCCVGVPSNGGIITSPYRDSFFYADVWVSGNSRTYTWLFSHAFLHCSSLHSVPGPRGSHRKIPWHPTPTMYHQWPKWVKSAFGKLLIISDSQPKSGRTEKLIQRVTGECWKFVGESVQFGPSSSGNTLWLATTNFIIDCKVSV